jgi:hypothetical protein
LTATGSTLSQTSPTVLFNSNYTAGAADRASTYVWNGGVGTLTLPAAATVGDGFFISVRNGGSGNLTIDPSGSELINGGATLVLRPGDSAIPTSDGLGWYTIGYGQQAIFAFDYTSIDITGESDPYTLSGAELNRVAYRIDGTLTADLDIIVPPTTQQYWIDNSTTGSFDLGFRTSSQAVAVVVPQGSRGIYYCDGSDVVNAATAGVSTPIAVADGGTGATTAGAALINLGGTTDGIALFTAASADAARAVINAVTPEDAQKFAVAIS